MGHNAPCSDNRIIAYRNSGHNLGTGTYPNISPDMDRKIINVVMFTQNRQNGVSRSGKDNIGGHHGIITDIDMLIIYKRDI